MRGLTIKRLQLLIDNETCDDCRKVINKGESVVKIESRTGIILMHKACSEDLAYDLKRGSGR